MSDIREPALARLFSILQAVDGIKSATRNQDQFAGPDRPAVNLFDGDEQLPQDLTPQGLAFSGMAVVPIIMLPVVNLLVEDVPGAVGALVNQLRAAIIGAVLSDTQLATILNATGGRSRATGSVNYIGYKTRFSHSLAMDCDAEINFVLGYQLNPRTL